MKELIKLSEERKKLLDALLACKGKRDLCLRRKIERQLRDLKNLRKTINVKEGQHKEDS